MRTRQTPALVLDRGESVDRGCLGTRLTLLKKRKKAAEWLRDLGQEREAGVKGRGGVRNQGRSLLNNAL